MNVKDFRKRGKEMINYVADYMETVHKYPPLPNVEPGYIKQLIPEEAPHDPDKWEDVFSDIDRVIMPGMTHWQSPNFYSYYPATNSYPSLLAEILSNGLNSLGFTWASNPAGTELEMAVMDWLGKALDLPKQFLFGGKGGGVIQTSASESTLISLLAARCRIMNFLRVTTSDFQEGEILSKLVTYTSDQAHSGVERACLMGAVKCHVVSTDNNCSLRGDTLERAIAEDRKNGLIPFCVVASLGTTPSCAFDKLSEIGPICEKEGLWLHIDAAYAGAAFICPEFRYLMNGVEYADTFNFNPHKWMLVTNDCSAMWFKDVSLVMSSFKTNPVYLTHSHQGKAPDFRHLQIAMGKRFRSLKLWFVLRLFGIKGIQDHIRKHVHLAHEFEEYVKNDNRFEVANEVILGLVCFRLKGKSNAVNETLLKRINKDGRIHMVPAVVKGRYILRLCICSPWADSSDMQYAWDTINDVATKLLQEQIEAHA